MSLRKELEKVLPIDALVFIAMSYIYVKEYEKECSETEYIVRCMKCDLYMPVRTMVSVPKIFKNISLKIYRVVKTTVKKISVITSIKFKRLESEKFYMCSRKCWKSLKIPKLNVSSEELSHKPRTLMERWNDLNIRSYLIPPSKYLVDKNREDIMELNEIEVAEIINLIKQYNIKVRAFYKMSKKYSSVLKNYLKSGEYTHSKTFLQNGIVNPKNSKVFCSRCKLVSIPIKIIVRNGVICPVLRCVKCKEKHNTEYFVSLYCKKCKMTIYLTSTEDIDVFKFSIYNSSTTSTKYLNL